MPQNVRIDLTDLINKPSFYKAFGIYCWHAYNTNPKSIEVHFSKDNSNFVLCGKFNVALKIGYQYWNFDNPVEAKKSKYMKITIKESYGGTKTYLNQVFLFDDIIENDKKANESIRSNINLMTNENIDVTNTGRVQTIHTINTESDDNYLKTNSPLKFNDKAPISNNSKKINNLFEKNKTAVVSKKLFDDKKESHENLSIYLKKEKNREIDDDNHGYDNYKSIQSKTMMSQLKNNKDDDKNYKTLDDQLKDMESNLLKMKMEQKYEKRALTMNENEKNSFYSDTNKKKNNNNLSNYLVSNVDNSIIETKKTHTANFSHNLPLSKAISRNDNNANNNINNNNNIVESTNQLSKINAIEEKLNKLENDILTLTENFEKLLENISKIVDFKNNFTEQNMNFILTECKKYINSNANNEHFSNNNRNQFQTISQKNTIDVDSRGNRSVKRLQEHEETSITNDSQKRKPPRPTKNEKDINTLLDEKLDRMTTTIEQRIYNSLLKPALNSFEKNVSVNIDELKTKINSLTNNFDQTLGNIKKNDYSYSVKDKIFSPPNNRKINKNDNIQSVAEKLHEKLNEKERKLNKLQMQTNMYLKEKKLFSPKQLHYD